MLRKNNPQAVGVSTHPGNIIVQLSWLTVMASVPKRCHLCNTLEGHTLVDKGYVYAIECPEWNGTFYVVSKSEVDASKLRSLSREEQDRIWRYYVIRLNERGLGLPMIPKTRFTERIYDGYWSSYRQATQAVDELVNNIVSGEEIRRAGWVVT